MSFWVIDWGVQLIELCDFMWKTCSHGILSSLFRVWQWKITRIHLFRWMTMLTITQIQYVMNDKHKTTVLWCNVDVCVIGKCLCSYIIIRQSLPLYLPNVSQTYFHKKSGYVTFLHLLGQMYYKALTEWILWKCYHMSYTCICGCNCHITC